MGDYGDLTFTATTPTAQHRVTPPEILENTVKKAPSDNEDPENSKTMSGIFVMFLVFLAVMALVVTIIYFLPQLETAVRETIDFVENGIGTLAAITQNAVSEAAIFLSTAKAYVVQIANELGEVLGKGFNAIFTQIAFIFDLLASALTTIFIALRGFILTLSQNVSNFVSANIQPIIDTVVSVYNTIVAQIDGLITVFENFFNSL
jgi:hypothetical protein